MKKTAVIYDKWFDALGGGEMVACHIAKFLEEHDYRVTIACKKSLDPKLIFQKLNIQLQHVRFVEIWNHETRLQQLTKNKDLFINISFIDYSVGLAKRNIYYAHFPTPISYGPKEYLFNHILYPIISRYLKPIEFIDQPLSTTSFDGKVQYLLGPTTSIAFYYLNLKKVYHLKFFVHYEELSKTSLKAFHLQIVNAKIIDQKMFTDHRHNVVKYSLRLTPLEPTINFKITLHNCPTKAYLIEPHLFINPNPHFVTRFFEQKFFTKIRSGVFEDIKLRLNHFDTIIVHSQYVAHWVNKYWHRQALVLYPPVEILSRSRPINYRSKKNIICSVGRFFTQGHCKRQDVLVRAFIKLYSQGFKDWELHLAGGLGNDSSSLSYFANLKHLSQGYPIYFHLNLNRQEIVDLYFRSKIYWHATGYGQDKNKYPINFEHFGITPVEAMSAGCLPLLFNGGGLPETIKLLHLNPTLFLFNTIPELVAKTKNIIHHSVHLKINQKRLDRLFSINSFRSHLREIIDNQK